MSRPKTVFACTACGHQSPRWMGRCAGCGAWNTLVEEAAPSSAAEARRTVRPADAPAAGRAQALGEVEDDPEDRLSTTVPELDRILGGGITRGSLVLVGGDPGVGKSTLLLQVVAGLARSGEKVLYASGEESAGQVKGRAVRLGLKDEPIWLLAETDLQEVLRACERLSPALLVVDSVQTVYTPELTSAPGSVSQVREVGSRLMYHAKSSGTAIMTVGHITKEGTLAGPKALEHIVDTVVYFEGDGRHPFRTLRATKNRFGPSGELALFEMVGEGLRAVPDPSALLLAERPVGRPGTAVAACLEGSRPLLIEVQALVARGVPGAARRTAVGLDGPRLAMLVAVLEKEGIPLYDRDIFMNVAGGVRITEPAADLAILAAIASSLRNRAIPGDLAILGEVGLTGEVRGVSRMTERVREAERHGFRRVLIPARCRIAAEGSGTEVIPVPGVREALDVLFG